MNIVTESKKHEKITCVSDCLKPDSITDNLWTWAERLEKLGKILFWIIIISGIVFAIATSIVTKEVVKGTYYQYTDTETTFSFDVFLMSIVQTALYAFIEYCSYHVLALLIGALANITQNTKTTARLTEYVARKTLHEETLETTHIKEPKEQTTETIEADERQTITEENSSVIAEIRDNEKVCPNCGLVQDISRKKCWACGQKFEN